MRASFWFYPVVGLLLLKTDMVYSLQCWKCISDDCEGDLENNYKAEKVSCKTEESCMKTLYRFQDNTTTYESSIKSCSSGLCKPTSIDHFNECLESEHDYLVLGCSRRLCCQENMCNHGNTHSIDTKTIFSSLTLVVLYLMR